MYNKKILIDALKKLGSAKAPTQKKDTVVGSNNPTEMLAMQKGFSPYDKKLNVKKSNIHGKGLFTEQPVKKGELIGLAHVNNQPTPIVGNFHNHSENNATALSIRRGNQRYLVAAKDLEPGTEITTNYRLQPELGQPEDFSHSINETPTARRGGSIPKLPNKKNSRAYSRSLDATNRLFAEHPWFKKSKSRKNKIYDPNAKYYQDGGTSYSNLPATYLSALQNFVYPEVIDLPEETDSERYGYDAALGVIKQNPNDPIANMNNPWWREHELFHHLQNQAGAMSTYGLVGQRPNPYVASDEAIGSYYDRRGAEFDIELNKIFEQNPNISEEEAFALAEENLYRNPKSVEGEARDYEGYIETGNSSIFPKRKKGGALPKAQDGGEQDGMLGMMKSKLAYANEFGNPAAKRMINIPDNPYDFGNGMTGTHYMASMDNYAVPQIQDENGQLVLGDYGPDSKETIKFDRPEDAEYFAEHYKEVSPGFIEAELTPEEIEEYAKGGYIIEDISVPSLNKMKNGGLEWPPKRLPGQASRALEIIREPEMISTYLGQTTPNLRLPSLRSINIDQFKNLDQWDLKNRKLVYPFKIEAPSGVLEIKPHDYSNVDQNLWELYANMPNQIEAGRAFYMLNQMLQPEPTILQRDSLSSDSLNTMLSVGNKKDWDAEYVGDLPFNFMGRNNQIFKGLNIPTYAPTGVSTPLGEQMVERLNSFIKDKGYGDEAYIATVPGFPRASVYVPNYRLKRRWKNGGEFKKYQPGGQINAIKAIEELRNLKPIRNIGSFQIAPFKTPVFKLPDIKLPDIKMPAVTVASTFIPTISPKDWSKNWNKATGDFQGLMKEYADIEQRTKADNTWMKNADGSPYLGSEYEYIQEQSEPFKKAFPEGFNQVFRGVNKKTAFRDFSRGKKLSGDRAMFTGDYLVGDDYAKFHSRQDDNNILTPFVQDNVTGLYNLIYPKGKEVIYNAGADFWSNIGSGISDFNNNALLSEFELETTKKLLNARLERLLELQKNNPSNFLKNEIADIQNRFLLLNNNETAFNRIMPGTDLEQLRILNSELKPPTKNDNLDILDRVTTNTLAEAISRTGLNSVILQNVVDGPFGDVHIVNNRPGNYLKSKIGNQGFFKQTPGAGSNIYHKMGGESNYELGDEVDEATMKQLKKLGYTFEKI